MFNYEVKKNKVWSAEAQLCRKARGTVLTKQKRHSLHSKVKGEKGKEQWGGTLRMCRYYMSTRIPRDQGTLKGSRRLGETRKEEGT